MTTICGFKRNHQVVLAWDTLTTEYGKVSDVTQCKGEMFVANNVFWSMASAGSSSVGRRILKILKDNLGEKDIYDISDILHEELRKFVTFNEESGEPKTQRSSALLTDGRKLYEIDDDLFLYEMNTCFKGSGAELARGVYEALKNTKISNRVLLERIYGIVGSIDRYTSTEFVTNLP